MQIVTAQEIKDYVLAQSDDKPVDNNQNSSFGESGCGCIMVQYGRERLGLENFGCGFSSWENGTTKLYRIENNEHIDYIFGLGLGQFLGIKTFGELKQYCGSNEQ